MRATLRRVHRILSLTLASIWLVQALTGLIMVFHWEWDDALVPGAHRPLDAVMLGAATQRVQRDHPASKVVALYATAGFADRFDIYLEDAAGRTDIVRVNGAGHALTERPLDHDYVRAGFIQAAIVLHQTLFAGDTGKYLLGCSALLLLTTMTLGVKLAWPRRGEWRRALLPGRVGARAASPTAASTASRTLPQAAEVMAPHSARRTASRAASLFAWHRACGLWLVAPALVLVTAGMLLAFEDPLENWLGTGSPPPLLEQVTAGAAHSLATARLDPGATLATALARFPGASLSSLRMPAEHEPWYRVRLLQPGEPERVYGHTAVYVSADDGRVLAVEDAHSARVAERFMNLLYPVHTGEVLGLPGRLLVLALGGWLLSMLVLGVWLWSARR